MWPNSYYTTMCFNGCPSCVMHFKETHLLYRFQIPVFNPKYLNLQSSADCLMGGEFSKETFHTQAEQHHHLRRWCSVSDCNDAEAWQI